MGTTPIVIALVVLALGIAVSTAVLWRSIRRSTARLKAELEAELEIQLQNLPARWVAWLGRLRPLPTAAEIAELQRRWEETHVGPMIPPPDVPSGPRLEGGPADEAEVAP